MADEPVIRVEGLWKRYGLPLVPAMKSAWKGLVSGDPETGDTRPWALKEVSFEVRRGEAVGIIGRNGAGKSTLLKVLAGVSVPTRGTVEVRGSMFPMIELNAGLHMELSGRENVMLLGAVMGLDRREMRRRFSGIEEFSELGEWLDRPVRMYSSGMLARLGFSVAMNVPADLLLIDEVLAVGDLAFQKKCFARVERMRENNTAVLFVSHNIRQIERFCDRAMIFSSGELVAQGESARVAEEYYSRINRTLAEDLKAGRGSGGPVISQADPDGIVVTSARFADDKGVPVRELESGQPVWVHLELESKKCVKDVVVGVALLSVDQIPVTSFSTDALGRGLAVDGSLRLRCRIPQLPLNPGVFSMRIKVVGQDGRRYFLGQDMDVLEVVRPHSDRNRILAQGGLIRIDPEWTVGELGVGGRP